MERVLVLLLLTAFPASAGSIEQTIPAEVVRVYDGDSLVVRAAIWPRITVEIMARVRALDTPEIRSRCSDASANAREHALAIAARDHLTGLVGSRVWLRNISPDTSPGDRILAQVLNEDGVDVGEAMIKAGHGVRYDGKGRRKGFCS